MSYLLNNDYHTKCECWDSLGLDLNDDRNIEYADINKHIGFFISKIN